MLSFQSAHKRRNHPINRATCRRGRVIPAFCEVCAQLDIDLHPGTASFDPPGLMMAASGVRSCSDGFTPPRGHAHSKAPPQMAYSKINSALLHGLESSDLPGLISGQPSPASNQPA